jgi:hypothetical protein
MAGGRGKRNSTAALQYEAVKKANIIYNATANDALLANLMGTQIKKKDILDTSGDIDNKSVSDDFKKSLKNTAHNLRRVFQPDTKMCNKCHELPATDVITPETGFDESRKSTATTCRECAMQDDTNVYVQDAALCGHGMERFGRYIECKICVDGRHLDNIVNSGGVCRECKANLGADNTADYYCGKICMDCNKNAKDATHEKNKIDVQCNDCGETYRKREKQRGKAVKESRKEYKLCDNFINEVGLHCKLICQETKVVGDITMRCRSARHTRRRGDKNVVDSKCCGKNDKCNSHKKKGDGHWFVCLAVQDDRKTPESLPMCEETAIGSSENDQDDRKMAAV